MTEKEAVNVLIESLKDYQHTQCNPFVPSCGACNLYLLYGLLVDYKATLEYGEQYD